MKKRLSLLFFLLTSTSLAWAQTPACHSAEEASQTFARLSEDPDFRAAHPAPQWMEGELKGEMVVIHGFDGSEVNAYHLKPEEESDNWVLVFHEWWGLNDHIKHTADSLQAALGGQVHVLALDMYDGQVTTRQDKAGELMNNVDSERAKSIIKAGIREAGRYAKIATIGWCMGGGYSLQAAFEADKKLAGCVMYYGMPVMDVEQLQTLKAPLLGIFAAQDKWITKEKAVSFDQALDMAQVEHEVHYYNAQHAFANPSNPQYNAEATADAWQKSVAFLQANLLGE